MARGFLHLGILVLLLLASPLRADDKQALREDAIELLDVGPFPLDVIGSCKGYLAVDGRLVKAILDWNQRNRAVLDKVVQVIRWTGGISDKDMGALRARGNLRAHEAVAGQTDKAAYCNDIVDQIDAGRLDLDRNSTTAPAANRVLAAKLE